MAPRLERTRRLVEPDVSVGADPQHLQVDSPGQGNLPFVPQALCVRILGAAIEEVTILRPDVHVAEQVLPHEAAIAAWMRRREAEKLVEVESRDAGEIDPGGVKGDELTIERERRAPGGQTEDQPGMNPDEIGNPACQGL